MSDRQTPNTIDPYLEAPAGALSAVPARPAGRCRQQPAADTEEAACGRPRAMTLGDAMTSGNRQIQVTPVLLQQARTLALLEFSDEEIAEVLGLTLADMAQLAWNDRDFFHAITPSAETKNAYRDERARRSAMQAAAKRRRLAASPSARMRNGVSARMWAALKGRSDGALFSRLGYSLQELIGHLQGQFSPGMTMENYGRWHVDHIRPCASFDQTDPEQFAACWALTNLQPLWARDNIRKGARTWQD